MYHASPISHAARSAAARRIRYTRSLARPACLVCGGTPEIDVASGQTLPHICRAARTDREQAQ